MRLSPLFLTSGGIASAYVAPSLVIGAGLSYGAYQYGNAVDARLDAGQTIGQSFGGWTGTDIVTGQQFVHADGTPLSPAELGDMFGTGTGTVVVLVAAPKVFRAGHSAGVWTRSVAGKVVPGLSATDAAILNAAPFELYGPQQPAATLSANGVDLASLAYARQAAVALRGRVSGFREIMSKARAAELGDRSALGELEAAKWFRAQGRNVHFQTPTGTRGATTADFLVEGRAYDVYTPFTDSPNGVIRGIFLKESQAPRVILNLKHTPVTSDSLGGPSTILSRVNSYHPDFPYRFVMVYVLE
jgi:hypothetical protein